MKKEKDIKIRLENSIYNTKCIKQAALDFSSSIDIVIKKNGNYTEVSMIASDEDDVAFEFANYALFLTIQLK